MSYANGLFAGAAPGSALSPNPRNEPPTNPLGVVAIARQLRLEHTVFGYRAVQQERQTEDDQEFGRKP